LVLSLGLGELNAYLADRVYLITYRRDTKDVGGFKSCIGGYIREEDGIGGSLRGWFNEWRGNGEVGDGGGKRV
jgi:hypothetical protein